DQFKNYSQLLQACGPRSAMGEFIWQLRRRAGVISLFWDWGHGSDKRQFRRRLYRSTVDRLRALLPSVLDRVNFEYQYWHDISACPNDLAILAVSLLLESCPKDKRKTVEEKLNGMDNQDLFERCREFLTEHDYLIFFDMMDTQKGLESWDLIKQHLLCESTRATIVVLTRSKRVATYCVDGEECRALNLINVMKGFCGKHESSHKLLLGRTDEDKLLQGQMKEFPLVTFVWGIAGVGKSAIVSFFYDLVAFKYDMCGWVDVPHPFNLRDLCRSLLLDFYSDDVYAKETALIGMMEGQDPIQGCRKVLSENKCLLVIDGLQSTHDWDLIKSTLLFGPVSGSSTIVITREESIATYCADRKQDIINVKGLETGKALYLFRKITIDGKQLPSQAETISKLIVSKCGGIPEVIVAIGKYTREYIRDKKFLESINADFMGCLETNSVFPSLTSLFCWMQSYFDACSDELKPCIFYMAVFPADQSIRKSRLLRRWIAEGYSSGGGGTEEEKVEKLMSELMKLSILYQEQQKSTMIKSHCKVNGFFREYIKSRPMEDNLVFELEGNCSPSSQLTGQHLTISSSWDRDEIVFKSMDLSRLRSLTVFGEWRSFLICDKMKLLRVLDLEGTSSASDGTGSVTDEDLEKIVKQFPRLKFMSLRRCVLITYLPDALGSMRQLETLDVRHTSIVELPPAIITKLHKLQYIRAGNTIIT
uniref:Uncharacterized protein n=1 Tax=Aegilops tauschii subsp. strangulata TaxID=200361 RepID=A0A453TDF8_AEGTS